MARRLCTLGLALLALALAAPGALARDIVVTTPDDVAAEQATDELAVRACARTVRVAGPVLGSSETTANAALDESEGSTPVADPKVTPCSLRLALLAANANEPATDPEKGDVIVFDLPAFAEAGREPRLTFDPVPLPPVTDPYLTIDGCGLAEPRDMGPCVDVELPELSAAEGTLAGAPGSVVPPNPNGLVVLAQEVSVTGLAFLNGNPAIWHPPTANVSATLGANPNLSVTNCFFGLDRAGGPAPHPGDIGILLSSDHAKIGQDPSDNDPVRPLRNVFAQGQVGVLIAGGSDTIVERNWFGTGADAKPVADPAVPLRTGVKIVGLGADATALTAALVPAEEIDSAQEEVTAAISSIPLVHLPSQGLPDGGVADTAERRGVQTTAINNTIGGDITGGAATTSACDGACNLFVALARNAIDVGGDPIVKSATAVEDSGDAVGASGTEIKGNVIGVDGTGLPAGTDKAGIVVRNGSIGTTIGGGGVFDGNVISNSADAGVAVLPGAGIGTEFAHNTGVNNGDPIFDLSGNGPGNPPAGPNGGVQAPVISTADPGVVAGTAAPEVPVHLYRAPAQGDGVVGWIGDTTADESGAWAVRRASIAAGDRVVASVDGAYGTSEFTASPATVTTPPQPVEETVQEEQPQEEQPVVEPEPGPEPPPPPPPDQTPPAVVEVAGTENPQAGSGVIDAGGRQPISGRATDPSGIREVFVALAVPSSRKARGSAAPRCNFIDVRRSRVVRRRCSRPLFFKARGTDDWTLPLRRKTRTLLVRARFVTLYLELTDNAGNTSLQRYRIRFGRRSSLRG